MLTDYDGQRICGVADHFGSVLCRWPQTDRRVTIFATGRAGEVAIADAAEWAIQAWNEACGIRMEMSTNPKTANLYTRSKRLDGPGNVLAQCQLPCGVRPDAQLFCDVDDSELYVLGENPPAGRVDLGRTLRHEYGHGIGIGHISDGNLMAPRYSSSLWTLKNGDIMEGRARYGDPVVTPPAVPIPGGSTPDAPRPVNGPRLEFVDPDGRRWRLNGVWEQV